MLQEPSTIISGAEYGINSSSFISIYNLRDMIVNVRNRTLREEIIDRAESLDWESLPPLRLIRAEDVRKWFGVTHNKGIIYLRRKNWYNNWIVVITMGDNGEHAWVADL